MFRMSLVLLVGSLSIGCVGATIGGERAAEGAPRCVSTASVTFAVSRGSATPIPDGRVIVLFYQLIDDIRPEVPPSIGYDQTFTGASKQVTITMSGIVLPQPIDDYYVCRRACDDRTDPACRCAADEAKLALAGVWVVRDANLSGRIEPSELLVADNLIGVGFLGMGTSDAAYPASSPLEALAPEGIQECLAPYSILPPPDDSGFHQLGIPQRNEMFWLHVCAPEDDACELVLPNLT